MAPLVRIELIFSCRQLLEDFTLSFNQIDLFYSTFDVHLNRSSTVICEKSDEKEFRVVIKHYFLKGKALQETKAKLDKHYNESSIPSIRTIDK